MLNKLFRLAARLRSLYWYVVRPKTEGVKVIAVSDGHFLLVKTRYTTYWALPGGGQRRGESPVPCAMRELREECGLSPSSCEVLGTFINLSEYKEDHITVIVADVSGQALRKGAEVEDLGYFHPESLPLTTSPATRRRLTEYLAGQPMGGKW